jgi:hypothetical protein
MDLQKDSYSEFEFEQIREMDLIGLNRQVLIEKQTALNKLEAEYADLVRGLGDDAPTGK